MSGRVWLKIGAVAALWTIIAGAAYSGWLVGRGESARQLSELQQRLTTDSLTPSLRRNCGIEVELLDAREADKTRERLLPALMMGTWSLRTPSYLHLREMLTSR